MKKQNGFTLIELLAVIIILAVIALIATPIVLNVVDKAKESSRQSSIAGYADAAKLYVYDKQFENNGQVPSNEEIKNNTTNQGDKVVCGKDGETPGVYYSSQYGIVLHGCTVGNNDKLYYFASGKTYTNATDEPYNTIYDSIKGPQVSNVVYFNPVTNQVCTDYTEANSATGVKTGCMKWYIYKIDGDNVGLLLDHNTTAIVTWVSKKDYIAAGGTEEEYGRWGNNSKGPITLLKQLQMDTTGWTASQIDIIDANDIAKITGNTTWTTGSPAFMFDTNTTTASETCKIGNISGCQYGWLYDRTSSSCTTNGCLNNSVGTEISGYWTKTTREAHPDNAWLVGSSASIYTRAVCDVGNYDYGVRPVITISKSNIK